MSNVYKRNRKHSQYAKFLITKSISKEIHMMYRAKDHKYFPKEFYHYYKSLNQNNDKIVKNLAAVYSERVRNTGNAATLESFDISITLLNEAIDISEGCIQLLQDYYAERQLYIPKLSKRLVKVSRRIQNLIINYILLTDELKPYLKTIKKKKKEHINKSQRDGDRD